jgi:Transposase
VLATSTALLERIPLQIADATEALAGNGDLVTSARFERINGKSVFFIEMDVRRRRWRTVFDLPRGSRVRWENVHTIEVQELSGLMGPILYRITLGDGCYVDASGQRRYFGVEAHLPGVDLRRGVSALVVRAAVLLAVVGGVGLRQVCWLLGALFHVEVSKSALDRWIVEAAAHLPDAEGMAQHLLRLKPVTEAHFDELFPRGRKGPVLVVRDEHGRILCVEEVEDRKVEQVVSFLEKLKRWGFSFQSFYIDHYEPYEQAIAKVFPAAHIQHDLFHILQNAWRKVWKAFVAHRKDIKARSQQVTTPWYAAKLDALAKLLWEKRGLLFTTDDHLTDEQRTTLADLVAQDPWLSTLRAFLGRVRGIFTDAEGELGARQRLGRLRVFADEQKHPVFGKVVEFLGDRFENMITFLRVPDVRRNSLAETGMRTLRRLEQGHDGFRSAQTRDAYVRLFQAIRYCGWAVHRRDGSLGIPAPS